MEPKRIEIGPVADCFLRALRAYEEAKNYYYLGLEAMMGEERGNKRMLEEQPTFDTVGELIENRIRNEITDWSISDPRRNTI